MPRPASPGRRSGFRTLVGYHAEVWRDGYAELVLDIGPQHLNSGGIVHGGVLATLLDAACGHAAAWVSVPGNVRRTVTISLNTNFLAPARSGRLRAIGRLLGIDARRIATLTAEVLDEAGDVIAICQASFRYERGSEQSAGTRPEKLREQ